MKALTAVSITEPTAALNGFSVQSVGLLPLWREKIVRRRVIVVSFLHKVRGIRCMHKRLVNVWKLKEVHAEIGRYLETFGCLQIIGRVTKGGKDP
eukprot:scaffold11876_cov31-Cyclotella_meneghiniana.AAC.1